jgi:hypothetical protein
MRMCLQSNVDVREFESVEKTQKGSTEVLTLHIAAFQSRGAAKKRTSLIPENQGSGQRSSGRRSVDPDYDTVSTVVNSVAMRVPRVSPACIRLMDLNCAP